MPHVSALSTWGIELDMVRQTAGVLEERTAKLSADLANMPALLGKLEFAAPFIQGGRACLASSHCALHNLAKHWQQSDSATAWSPEVQVEWSAAARQDLLAWLQLPQDSPHCRIHLADLPGHSQF